MKTLRLALMVAPLVSTLAFAHEHDAKGHADHAKDEKGECHHEPVKADAPKGEGWKLTRGEALKSTNTVALKDLLATPAKYDGKTVQLQGQVRQACTKKGCWMELSDKTADKKAAGVRVTFKDYAFFVPVDSAGSQARVEGLVKVAQLSEERAKHYEGEGAIVPRGKDGKAREVQLVATGVELSK